MKTVAARGRDREEGTGARAASPGASVGQGRRRLLAALGVAVLVAAPFGLLRAWPEKAPVPVELGEVSSLGSGRSLAVLSSSGFVAAKRRAKIGPRAVAKVSRVAVKEGDLVRAGDVLFELDDRAYRGEVVVAKSRVLAARARAETTRADLAEIRRQVERQRLWVREGIAGKATVDDLVAKADVLEARVRAADAEARAQQAEIEALELRANDWHITAPIDGTVISISAKLGEIVSPADAAAEIVDLSTLVVEAEVLESQLELARVGAPAEIELDARPERVFPGKVSELGHQVDRKKGTALVRVAFAEPHEGILPNMAARMRILAPAQAAPGPSRALPPSAVVERGGERFVFVSEDGRARKVPVTTGKLVGGRLGIAEGPPLGARIVLAPPRDLEDGARIAPR